MRVPRTIVQLLVFGAVLRCDIALSAPPAEDARDSAPWASRVAERHFGVPLPRGAVRRLGSAVFHPGRSFVVYSPDGRILASGGAEGWSTRLWDAATGEHLRKLDTNSCEGVVFSADSRLLFTAEMGKVRAWDLQTGKSTLELTGCGGPDDFICCLAISEDGGTVAAGGKYVACVWDAKSGKVLLKKEFTHGHWVRSVSLSRDGRILASTVDREGHALWNVPAGKALVEVAEDEASGICFSPKGNVLALRRANTIDLLDGGSLAPLRSLWRSPRPPTIDRADPHKRQVGPLTFSAGGEFLACADGIYSVQTGKRLAKCPFEEGGIGSIALSPDGRTLATAGRTVGLMLWDIPTGEPLIRRAGHREEVVSLAFSSDGKTLASAGFSEGTILWDAATGKEIRRLPRYQVGGRICFAPDSDTLVSAYVPDQGKPGAKINLWKATTGEKTGELAGHNRQVLCIAISSNGKLLASGSEDRTIGLWDLPSRRMKSTIRLPKDSVACLAFSPDGRVLAAGGPEGTIRRWDTATGTEMPPLEGHRWMTVGST